MKKFFNSLFSSPLNIVMTLFWLGVLVYIFPPFIKWAFIDAVFVAENGSECSRSGACWAFITARFDDFMFGRYPNEERWRVIAGLLLPLAIIISGLFLSTQKRTAAFFIGVLCFPFSVFFFFYGGFFGLEIVETRVWGGFALTLVIAATSIASALPLGIILALGRRSEMPVVSMLCTIFIETARSVPMITILFVAAIMFPFFVPEGVEVDKLLRTIVAVALFAGAYMAEVIRGGLQALPKGQYEAASAMGHGYWQTMGLVILPQALTISIPAIVNLFIVYFKDTTLVIVIGLFDLMNMVVITTSDPEWFGYAIEGYLFVAFVFFVFCFCMGQYARKLEERQSKKRS